MSGFLLIKNPQASDLQFSIWPRDECAYVGLGTHDKSGFYVLRQHARFHPASSPMCVKPLIQSSSEAPFTCCGLPTLHHLPARCYPWQATPLHHRWRISVILYFASIAEMSIGRKQRNNYFNRNMTTVLVVLPTS